LDFILIEANLKTLQLLTKSSAKVNRGEKELSENDVLEIPKGLIPGEWIFLFDEKSQRKYVAFVNPNADIFYKIKIIKSVEKNYQTMESEFSFAEKTIENLIHNALALREKYLDYSDGVRLIYGINDSLPGLIVDKYKKYILIQINTAGLDRFRDLIKKTIKEKNQNHEVLFYDNEEYRKAEALPIHERDLLRDDLEVIENGLQYKIPKLAMQKVGYYYDHRENRKKLRSLIERLDIKKDRGLDLFSYVGSWGMHLLSSGTKSVVFVDQGQMQEAVLENLALNNFSGRGEFIRMDVFKYLDLASLENKKYNIIVSDPPAFTKSEKKKLTAIQGYEKLHTKALKILEDEALMVAASCTHYVSYEELDKTMQEAAFKNEQKLQLLDIGGQGFDHPMSGLKDKSCYIKYLVYYVSRGK